MALDHAQLERLLCDRLCAHVRVHRRHDDVLMLESPFTFPDGDHYPIYLSETPGGSVKLSDRGHTLMHVSYEHDVDSFHEGARASLREQIVRETGIDEEEGVFSIEAPPDQVATALFRFGQASTKIHDLTFLSRDRVSSTFYEDLRRDLPRRRCDRAPLPARARTDRGRARWRGLARDRARKRRLGRHGRSCHPLVGLPALMAIHRKTKRPSSSVACSARPIQLIERCTRSPIVSGNPARSARRVALRIAWTRDIGMGCPSDHDATHGCVALHSDIDNHFDCFVYFI